MLLRSGASTASISLDIVGPEGDGWWDVRGRVIESADKWSFGCSFEGEEPAEFGRWLQRLADGETLTGLYGLGEAGDPSHLERDLEEGQSFTEPELSVACLAGDVDEATLQFRLRHGASGLTWQEDEERFFRTGRPVTLVVARAELQAAARDWLAQASRFAPRGGLD